MEKKKKRSMTSSQNQNPPKKTRDVFRGFCYGRDVSTPPLRNLVLVCLMLQRIFPGGARKTAVDPRCPHDGIEFNPCRTEHHTRDHIELWRCTMQMLTGCRQEYGVDTGSPRRERRKPRSGIPRLGDRSHRRTWLSATAPARGNTA